MVGIIGRPCESKYVKKIPEKFVNSIKNRFYAKILIPNENGCMIWNGSKDPRGYGGFVGLHKKMTSAHRYSYQLHIGIIPKGMFVCHKCDNPSCVNPEHLFLGTNSDNHQDMLKKGREKDNSGTKNGMSKLDESKVIEIKKLLSEGNLTHKEIGNRFNISRQVVSSLKKKGMAWKIVENKAMEGC